MSINIEVTNKKSDLSQEIFTFYLSEHPLRLQLSEYSLGERKTRRHAFEVTKYWSKDNKRDNTISKTPPLTDNICNQAKLKLLNLLADITVD